MLNRRGFLASGAALAATSKFAWAQQSRPYILGGLLTMSGTNAYDGQSRVQGMQLAIEHIKQDNWLKQPIELTVEDSQGTPAGGAVGCTKLINVSQAQFILTTFTGVSKAAAPIAERTKTILANCGGLSPDLAALTPYFWNVVPLATKELEQMLPWMVEKDYKRVVLIYVDDPFGGGVRAWLEQNLPANGGELASSLSVPGSAQQFSAVAAQVRSASPDAVFIASYGAQQAQIIKQLRDNGVTSQLLSYSGTVNDFTLKLPEAEGLVFGVPSANTPDDVTQRFRKEFIARHGKEPTYLEQNSYNGVRVFAALAQDLEKSGTELGGDALNEAARRIKTFDLVGGKGSLDDQMLMTLPVQLSTFRGGAVVAL